MTRRLAVLADIHGNLAALEAVLADLSGHAVDVVVNLGDCASGPLWPAETVARLRALDWPTVRGNHDRWVGEAEAAPEGPSDRFAWEALSAAGRRWLRDLPQTLTVLPGVIACHARPDHDDAYLLDDVREGRLVDAQPGKIAARLGAVEAGVVLCGHSHRAGLITLDDDRVVLNPGSVGCPAYSDPIAPAHVSETGTPHARYALVEIAGGRLAGASFRAVPYPFEDAVAQAARNGRPDWAHALRTGRMSGR